MRSACVLCLFVLAASTTSAQELSFKKGTDSIEFYAGKKLITKFLFGDVAKPIFFPMHSPSGTPLTRSWPMVLGVQGESSDHIHQKSAWFCHGDVIAEGFKGGAKIKGVDGADFWSEALGHGKIVAVNVSDPKVDKDHISFVVKAEWRAGDQKILDETRTYRIYKLDNGYLIVMNSDLFASEYSIVFGDTKEGSFAIRINDQLAGKNGKGTITNAEANVGEKACWGRRSAWCDYSGPIDGKVAGIAIFADPKNANETCWHVRGYGLMAANPFGRNKAGFPDTKGKTDLVRIEKGGHLPLRYGMFLHDGDVTGAAVAQNYQRFVELRTKE